MMKASRVLLLVVACLVAATGCVTPRSFLGYLEDRRQDLIDVVHVEAGYLDAGAVIYAGPAQIGYETIDDFDLSFDFSGLSPIGGGGYPPPRARRLKTNRVQLGLGGPRESHRDGEAGGIVWPMAWWDDSRPFFGPRPKRTPSFFSVGLMGGYWFGIGAEADVLEAADFVLGLFCIDVGGDDEHVVPPAKGVSEADRRRQRAIQQRLVNPPPDKVVKMNVELLKIDGDEIRCGIKFLNAEGKAIARPDVFVTWKFAFHAMKDVGGGYAAFNASDNTFTDSVHSRVQGALNGSLYKLWAETDIPPAISHAVLTVIAQDNIDKTRVERELHIDLDPPVKTGILVKKARIFQNVATVPQLMEYLRDDDPDLRAEAAHRICDHAMYRLHMDELEQVLPALTGALNDSEYIVRGDIASALGYLGPAARPAAPALIRLLEDKKDYVLNYAIVALGKIGGEDAKKIVPLLCELIKNEKCSMYTRGYAVDALGRIGGEDAKAMIPYLRELAKSRNPYLKEPAERALKQLDN